MEIPLLNKLPPVGNSQPSQPAGSIIAPEISTPPPVQKAPSQHSHSGIIKTIVIILLSLLLILACFGIFYFYTQYIVARSDVDSQIDVAVLEAIKEQEDELREKFAEEAKSPFETFTGPADYGSLSFKYPRTWSVYVAKDASNGGEFVVYLHPKEVPPISETTVNALRVTIRSESFETATNRYAGYVKKGTLSSSTILVNGADAVRYDGSFSNNFVGSVVIVKIRDKVATLQTDAEIYRDDFNNIIESLTFNE